MKKMKCMLFCVLAAMLVLFSCSMGEPGLSTMDKEQLTAQANGSSKAIISGKIYRIESVHSGKVLDVAGYSQSNGGNIQQWSWAGNNNQKWKVVSVGNGQYRIESVHSGKVIDVSGNSQNNGANIYQWGWAGTNNQKWKIVSVGNGQYKIESVHSGKVLDVTGYSQNNGGNIQQWSWAGNNNQKWKMIEVGSQPPAGNYVIAVSSDGNDHDTDDWGATALTLAILARAGLQSKVVHYDYCNHIWGSKNGWEAQMEESAKNGARKFGFNANVFINSRKETNRAVNQISSVVNNLPGNTTLYFLLAGPMETAYRGLKNAHSNKRKQVICISHSKWNDYNQASQHPCHTDQDIINLGVKKWYGNRNGTFGDQNPGFGKRPMSKWAWLKSYPNGNWVYSRIDAVYQSGDASDAGMAYFMLTGHKKGNTDNLKNWFQNPKINLIK